MKENRLVCSSKTAVETSQRHVILHYHLYKNAGTSLDHILKANFKDDWHEQEGPGTGWRVSGVEEYLQQHPEIAVLSSHTALLPVPQLSNTTIYPILFIRHPIDRVRSIYEFERRQTANTEGARLAKETDISGYIQWRMERTGDRSIRNFQSYRLAFAVPEILNGKKLSEQERAIKAVEILPFIGVVEKFDDSLIQLQIWLKTVFPNIEMKPKKLNVTKNTNKTLDERLKDLRNEIGTELYMSLIDANGSDIALWQKVAD